MSKKSKKMNMSEAARRTTVSGLDNIIFYILMFLLGILPIIVRITPVNDYSPLISGSVLDTGLKYDISTYYKLGFLLIGAGLLLAVYLYKIIWKKYTMELDYTSVAIGALYFLILLSALAAPLKSISLFGFYNSHEGTLAYLSCLVIFFAAANVHYKEKMLRILTYCLYPTVIINASLSLLWFYGVNVLKFSFVQGLILPSSLPASGLGNSMLQSTLTNPNYVSGIGSVFTLFFIIRLIMVKETRASIVNLIFALISFSMIISAKATSGFFTLVLLTPLIVFFVVRPDNRRQGIVRFGAAIIGFSLILGTLSFHDHRAWDESIGFFVGSPAQTTSLTSPEGKQENLSPNDEFYLPPKSLSAGTGRIYIWRKTIDLVQKRPVLGYGLDTLAYYFPQHDMDKITGDAGNDELTQKPHNMYLDIAYGSGVLALGVFLALIIRHLYISVKLLVRPLNGERRIVVASLFAAWLAFLVQGLFNDFIIGTSIIFWILFGVSVSLSKEELKIAKVQN